MEKTELTVTVKGTFVGNDGTIEQIDSTFERLDSVFLNTFRFVDGEGNSRECEHDTVTLGLFGQTMWENIIKSLIHCAGDELDAMSGAVLRALIDTKLEAEKSLLGQKDNTQ